MNIKLKDLLTVSEQNGKIIIGSIVLSILQKVGDTAPGYVQFWFSKIQKLIREQANELNTIVESLQKTVEKDKFINELNTIMNQEVELPIKNLIEISIDQDDRTYTSTAIEILDGLLCKFSLKEK